jgi:hypothetical protein
VATPKRTISAGYSKTWTEGAVCRDGYGMFSGAQKHWRWQGTCGSGSYRLLRTVWREVTNGARLLVSAKELLGWKGPDAFGKAGLL